MDRGPATSPRRGRPPSTRAQEAIHAAATRLFAEKGFSGTSVRDIAAEASVDPSIVIRHFGSKEALFLQSMSVDQGLRGITDGPLDTLGRHILERLVLHSGPEQAKMFRALVGAIDRADVRTYLERSAQRHIVQPLAARLDGPDADLRAQLVATQVAGLLMSLWVLQSPALQAVPPEHLIQVYGQGLQALIGR